MVRFVGDALRSGPQLSKRFTKGGRRLRRGRLTDIDGSAAAKIRDSWAMAASSRASLTLD